MKTVAASGRSFAAMTLLVSVMCRCRFAGMPFMTMIKGILANLSVFSISTDPLKSCALGRMGTITKSTGYEPVGLAHVRRAAAHTSAHGVPLVAIACWRLNDPAFDFDSSFILPSFRDELTKFCR